METALTLTAWLLGIVIGGTVGFLLTAMVCVLEGIPVFKISKKLNITYPWLTWLSFIPYVGPYARDLALIRLAGNKPVKMLGNWTIQSRTTAAWIYIVGSLGGTMICTVLYMLPFVGLLLGPVANLVLIVFNVVMQAAFLRDALDLFKPDRQSNSTTAVWITIANALTLGFVRPFILMSIMNEEPLQDRLEETR